MAYKSSQYKITYKVRRYPKREINVYKDTFAETKEEVKRLRSIPDVTSVNGVEKIDRKEIII